MKCEFDKTQIIQWINNEMTGSEKEIFEKHLMECPDCSRQLKAYQYLWGVMEEIPVPEPSGAMMPKFHDMLATFQAAEKQKKSFLKAFIERIRDWWILQPKSQLAYGIVLLLIGAGAGFLLHRNDVPNSNVSTNYKIQMDSLSSQVKEMKQMMMLTLLENPSASERIRGVTFTNEIKSTNKQMLDALISTLNNDPNVNVRLVTLDALTHFADNAAVREALVQSIVRQESPLVQSAMADVMLKLQEKRAIQPLKQLLQHKELNEMVKTKIEQTINQLI